jgi:hypothetical protein
MIIDDLPVTIKYFSNLVSTGNEDNSLRFENEPFSELSAKSTFSRISTGTPAFSEAPDPSSGPIFVAHAPRGGMAKGGLTP